jgi:hypothetical protein
MSKNSTINLWYLLLKEEYSAFDRVVHKVLSSQSLDPKEETVNKILSYASSVRGIKTKSTNRILISLN